VVSPLLPQPPGPFPRKGRGVSLSLVGERFGEGQVPPLLGRDLGRGRKLSGRGITFPLCK